MYTSVLSVDPKQAVKETRQHAHHEMSSFLRLGRLRRLRHQAMVEEGEVADVIPRLAQEHAIDLLVIGTLAVLRWSSDHQQVDGMFLGRSQRTPATSPSSTMAWCRNLRVPPRRKRLDISWCACCRVSLTACCRISAGTDV